jgi:hypothetical protein
MNTSATTLLRSRQSCPNPSEVADFAAAEFFCVGQEGTRLRGDVKSQAFSLGHGFAAASKSRFTK